MPPGIARGRIQAKPWLEGTPHLRSNPWGREDLLEKEMATRCSILAWRIPMDRGAW